MPPPSLKPEDEFLISAMVNTFRASCGNGGEPKSFSDMKWGMMGILTMFEVKLRPLPVKLEHAE